MSQPIRNIAIIAHVDHGKTTITDAIMRQTGAVTDDTSMDSNKLEQERGITIYAKNTSVIYKDTKINIVDTPGHADFGSEVERVLRSIDSVLLVVDAQEGPMPQTRFVLKKSLQLGLKPIVIINKIDKPASEVDRVFEEVYELFLDLGANDDQLDFPVVYAIGREGKAKKDMNDEMKDLTPLLDTILEYVPVASSNIDTELRMQAFNLAYDDFLGRLAVGRIHEGVMKQGQELYIKNKEGIKQKARITKLFNFHGVKRQEIEEAYAGDIVMVGGFSDVYIGDTFCENESQEALPAITVDEPTISLKFLVNDSPFAGREGKFVTNQQIRERLKKELEINVGLRIDFTASDHYMVYGRGELHIAILLENMRREGYEVQVSQPHVIFKEIEGVKSEPFEEVTIDVPTESAGSIMEAIGKRKGVVKNMSMNGDRQHIIAHMPTRGLLGYRGQFVVDTKGEGILCSQVLGFEKFAGDIVRRATGSMISGGTGKALGFSLYNLQSRGKLYIEAATEVYEGQVIGNTSKGDEMTVNPLKGKQLTNMRASSSDEAITLITPMLLSIETGLEVMANDEYLEVTPKSVRLRKQFLKESDRTKVGRKKK